MKPESQVRVGTKERAMQQIAGLRRAVDDLPPFIERDYEERHRRASELMKDQGVDVLVLTCTPNQLYYTGLNRKPMDRIFASILPRDGQPFHFCPFFEKERANERLKYGRDQVTYWHEDENPYQMIRDALSRAGFGRGVIAVDPETPFRHVEYLRETIPSARLTSGETIVWRQLMIKEPKEIVHIRRLQEQVEVAAAIAYANLWEGESEEEFDQIAAAAVRTLGFGTSAFYSASFGPNTAVIYGAKSPRRLESGMVIKAGLHGATLGDYSSDMSRASVFGEPTPKFAQAHRAVREAQMVCFETIKPGVLCDEIDRVARRVVAAHGFGDRYTHFWHRVGHGYNIYGHHPHGYPFLGSNSTAVLQEDMIVSVEPALYFPGEWGFNIENIVRVTRTGCEVFGTIQTDVHTPFGSTLAT